jgi:hypothetical protein
LASFRERDRARHRRTRSAGQGSGLAERSGNLGVVAFVVVVVFFLLGAVGVLAITELGGSGSSVLPSDSPSQPSVTSASAPAGQSASRAPEPPASGPQTDGPLRFVVKDAKTSGGELHVVLSVTNLSAGWTPFYGEDQLAVGADGKYSRAVATLTYLEPGETVAVPLRFRLSAGFHAAHLQLHASSHSAGVAVALVG